MSFVVISKGGFFYVKNTKTGKVGSNKFKNKANAQKQVKNRQRFLRMIKNKT